MLDINSSKSYKTIDNLNKKLAELNLSNARYVVVCNFSGRYTAIFAQHQNPADVNIGYIVHNGFMVIG